MAAKAVEPKKELAFGRRRLLHRKFSSVLVPGPPQDCYHDVPSPARLRPAHVPSPPPLSRRLSPRTPRAASHPRHRALALAASSAPPQPSACRAPRRRHDACACRCSPPKRQTQGQAQASLSAHRDRTYAARCPLPLTSAWRRRRMRGGPLRDATATRSAWASSLTPTSPQSAVALLTKQARRGLPPISHNRSTFTQAVQTYHTILQRGWGGWGVARSRC